MQTIKYHGEHFRLTHSADDYDKYKETPNNIQPAELARIEAKILSVQIAKEFITEQEFLAAALNIKFPGFGFGGLDSEENLRTATIEIPQKEAERYITAIERNGRWYVIDDFKGPTAYDGMSVEIQNKHLVYRTHKGEEFRRKQLD
jgi:hypothetical protein